MSTFFPAGGPTHNTGPWWRVLHSAIEAGADLSALRLLHAAGVLVIDEHTCARLEQHMHADAACVCYDPSSLLIIEPGVTDEEVVQAAVASLGVSREQLHLWSVVEALHDGLKFEPIDPHDYTTIQKSAPNVAAHRDIVLTDAEFSYFPMWDVQKSEIFSYVCENIWNFGDDEQMHEDALQAFFEKPRHVFALDREALHKAVKQAQQFLDGYIFSNLMIPVHFSTMNTPDLAAAYLETCNKSIWPVVDNVYFEITKVPVGVNGDQLRQAVEALSPYGQSVLLRVEHGFRDFTALPTGAIFSVGLDFHFDQRADDDIKTELESFAHSVQPFGLRRHAHSLRNMDVCVTAVRAGYDFISSNVIAPPLDIDNLQQDAVTPPEVLRSILKGIV